VARRRLVARAHGGSGSASSGGGVTQGNYHFIQGLRAGRACVDSGLFNARVRRLADSNRQGTGLWKRFG
jgi:hypothetical protein